MLFRVRKRGRGDLHDASAQERAERLDAVGPDEIHAGADGRLPGIGPLGHGVDAKAPPQCMNSLHLPSQVVLQATKPLLVREVGALGELVPSQRIPGPAPICCRVVCVEAIGVAAGASEGVFVGVASLRVLVPGQDRHQRMRVHLLVREDAEHRIADEELVQCVGELARGTLQVDPEVEGSTVAVDRAEPVNPFLERLQVEVLEAPSVDEVEEAVRHDNLSSAKEHVCFDALEPSLERLCERPRLLVVIVRVGHRENARARLRSGEHLHVEECEQARACPGHGPHHAGTAPSLAQTVRQDDVTKVTPRARFRSKGRGARRRIRLIT
jgi:hypothetical protein